MFVNEYKLFKKYTLIMNDVFVYNQQNNKIKYLKYNIQIIICINCLYTILVTSV